MSRQPLYPHVPKSRKVNNPLGVPRPVLRTSEEYLDRIHFDATFLIKQLDRIRGGLQEIVENAADIKVRYKTNPLAAHDKIGNELLPQIQRVGGVVSHTQGVLLNMDADAREILVRGI